MFLWTPPTPSHRHFFLPWCAGFWIIAALLTDSRPGSLSPGVPQEPHRAPLPKVQSGLVQADPTSHPSLLDDASHSERVPHPGAPTGKVEDTRVEDSRLPRPQGLDLCQGHHGGLYQPLSPRAIGPSQPGLSLHSAHLQSAPVGGLGSRGQPLESHLPPDVTFPPPSLGLGCVIQANSQPCWDPQSV